MDFQDKTVLITGAGGNLGRAVAHAFAERGARLVLADIDRPRLQQAYGGEGDARLFAPANLLDAAQVAAAVNQARQRFGSIDMLCNIAGGFRMGPRVHETADADWDFLLGLNAKSMLNAVRAVVPGMLESGGGKVVSVAANAALKGVAGMGAYCASKDVVIRLTESMSAELRDSGINVNCVLPSIIDTPENRAAMPEADFSRWVAPQALADVICFLCSDGARAIHGAALPVVGRS
ncbi:NADP-dependent 3-hydroxy acid dehydrogenase YdfG [Noviherbaspirillum humi]|uniref:NADP-dependent 3-hydroxy acid dehydrogenase YdfG n=1 Tax=Noviherbaspirillum humi TaxID=1688639 RepID=A0A239L660_9BURK|nr:SDR family NAD(P)-dependent oxidoreductase [Noviherbaspirillum humi]SNT25024.1 NADP-dependent 3-hydroxy acid dehydrogenase YdfG [Noviherbaspirillum humi]